MENIKNYNNLKHLNKFSGFPKRRKNFFSSEILPDWLNPNVQPELTDLVSFYLCRQAILSERRTDRRICRLFGRQQPSDWISSSIVAPLSGLRQRRALLAQGLRGRTSTRHRRRWVLDVIWSPEYILDRATSSKRLPCLNLQELTKLLSWVTSPATTELIKIAKQS